ITLLRPAPVTITPVARVNFQPQDAPVPAGYTADVGAAYDDGRSYGWVAQSSSAPLSIVGNARDRNKVADQRLDTLMHMQYSGTAGVAAPARWEYALPNGTYDVTVSVGDPSFFDSTHRLAAESTRVIDDFRPTAANPFGSRTVRIPVTDGRLTLDAIGGANTKLAYVDVNRVEGGGQDLTPPSLSISPTGTSTTQGTYSGDVTVTISASDTGSGLRSLTYRLDSGPSQPYTNAFVVASEGSHAVVATATDHAGNTASTTSSFTITR
ncbi:MAG: hypothetical protein LC713_04360, partial [Actinobacteria bacterium]|nr:hypothetical protein [Actinomycetota bacterium]